MDEVAKMNFFLRN